ncbi:hypothetical protein LINGRAHAP2_LOCUS31529, partial [Linum grandiflorum]
HSFSFVLRSESYPRLFQSICLSFGDDLVLAGFWMQLAGKMSLSYGLGHPERFKHSRSSR